MLELVRQQEHEVPVAVGTENEVLSCESTLVYISLWLPHFNPTVLT